ncbi:MAG: hypothetical protein ACREHD_16550 [Pirellulales bacterium]
MSLRWADDKAPVPSIPPQRLPFYQQVEARLRAYDPAAQQRIEAELRAWLDDVCTGIADYASVERNAGADWNGFERQAIYDVTQNWDHSRWWCGLLLMKLAIEHRDGFMGYKPGDPGSEISTAYFFDHRGGKTAAAVRA